MDVLAGRKTQGTITGSILINGRAVTPTQFASLVGYVEQEDVHNATSTVFETLMFAANLRLPASVDSEHKLQFVEEILWLLELDQIRDRIIGNNTTLLGLAPGQLKRVTMGVEL